MMGGSPTSSDVGGGSLRIEYAQVEPPRAARWRTGPPTRSRGRFTREIMPFDEGIAEGRVISRWKLPQMLRPLEMQVVGSSLASGFSGGSIPDREVGAPLKHDLGHDGG